MQILERPRHEVGAKGAAHKARKTLTCAKCEEGAWEV